MTAIESPREHIRLDESGRAWIVGTTTKVIEVALDHLAHGWSPEEIYFQHDRRIGMAQIYAALARYHDNQARYDAEIRRQIAEVDRLREEAGESPFSRRLRRGNPD